MDEASLLLFVTVIVLALLFDFTNGFQDAANAIASAVGTRAMKPKTAVLMSAILNFVRALLSIQVALTVGTGIVDPAIATQAVVLGGVVGGIVWNTVTWYFGIPSSASHALIGGLVGAALASAGPAMVNGTGVFQKVALPALIAPTLGLLGAMVFVAVLMRLTRRANPKTAHRSFRRLQIASAAWLSLTHGMNDAQKTMGVMFLATLTYQGMTPEEAGDMPMWIRLSAAFFMALGTYMGGWRVIKTLGSKVVKMQPIQGFSASTSSAAVLQMATQLGIPVSTTHTVTGGVLGAGAARRANSVRWSVAGDIVSAWVFTLPAAAGVGAATYYLTSFSPLALLALLAAGAIWLKIKIDDRRPERSIDQGFLADPPASITLGGSRPSSTSSASSQDGQASSAGGRFPHPRRAPAAAGNTDDRQPAAAPVDSSAPTPRHPDQHGQAAAPGGQPGGRGDTSRRAPDLVRVTGRDLLGRGSTAPADPRRPLGIQLGMTGSTVTRTTRSADGVRIESASTQTTLLRLNLPPLAPTSLSRRKDPAAPEEPGPPPA